MKTIRLTTAQALVRYLDAQRIFLKETAKKPVRLFAGGFGIFGHGNVPALGEALFDYRKKCLCTEVIMNRAWPMPRLPMLKPVAVGG